MKETVNVNIGSQAFTLDEDAYRVLRSYLDDIRSRLPEYDTETMGDIEVRIAEIFREIVSSPMRVITLDTVRTAMHRMGAPSDFGERRGNTARQEDEEAGNPQALPLAHRPFDRRHLRRAGRLLPCRCYGHAAPHAVPDNLRRAFDLGLHHPLDHHPRTTRPEIQY